MHMRVLIPVEAATADEARGLVKSTVKYVPAPLTGPEGYFDYGNPVALKHVPGITVESQYPDVAEEVVVPLEIEPGKEILWSVFEYQREKNLELLDNLQETIADEGPTAVLEDIGERHKFTRLGGGQGSSIHLYGCHGMPIEKSAQVEQWVERAEELVNDDSTDETAWVGAVDVHF